MKPNLGLKKEQASGVVEILTRLLADESVLYTKTRNCHWNVTGLHFGPLHTLFEKQYDELGEIVDEVAERIRALGGHAIGTLSEFLEHTRLKEEPKKRLTARKMLDSLLDDHESVVRSLREDLEACGNELGDAGTSDFLTGLMERHEKTAWMLRAHLDETR
jgi:starvation-inducible DNA-binding protein